jgi:hypothetical protein
MNDQEGVALKISIKLLRVTYCLFSSINIHNIFKIGFFITKKLNIFLLTLRLI